MQVIETIRAMQHWADAQRAAGRRIGFVPTMGFLHDGHLRLVELARSRADLTVVSIFVNPLQFGPREDFDRYPRDLQGDRRKLEAKGVDVLFVPLAEEMYPEGFQTVVEVREVTQGLCGASRPTHFRGVTTVVTKLFLAVKPHIAVFGEKDFQQLVTVRRMVKDLNFDVEVVAAPIVREADGLAMSSRNAYLSPTERAAARSLSQALAEARAAFERGERCAETLRNLARRRLQDEPLANVDYVELVDAETLRPISSVARPALLALAAFFGSTRLIDNCLLDPFAAASAATGDVREQQPSELPTEGSV
ncbi:MAG: pantothenate synthetase [Candidatus Binatia bacterium]|nr:MAG: pantothenate synthetase [Candidatus Binatia bacterium]